MLNVQVFNELLFFMIQDPHTVSRATRITYVSKYIERIADHATNIAEMVVYLVEGKIIRHMALPDDKKEGLTPLNLICYHRAMKIPAENRHLEESDKKYIWHPFTQMKEWLDEKPVIIAEGRDCFIKDIYGRWYLDAVSSMWVNIHGHRKKR